MPRLTIVLVTFNSAADVGTCLESIPRRRARHRARTIVVDNGSADGTAGARARALAARARDRRGRESRLRAGEQPRHSRDGQRAGAAAQSRYDAGPGAIDRLVAVLDPARVAVAGPRIVDSGGRAELSFGAMIGPLSELRQKLLTRGHAASGR
jgi:GT2 family glycosyltransferase